MAEFKWRLLAGHAIAVDLVDPARRLKLPLHMSRQIAALPMPSKDGSRLMCVKGEEAKV
jgi:hypothetical protein